MKRLALLIIFTCTLSSLPAASLLAGVDLMSLDSFYYNNVSLRIRLGADVTDEFSLSLDGAFTHSPDIDNQLTAIDLALTCRYRIASLPGFYVGVCIINPVLLYGYDAPEENLLFISSICLGWRLDVPFFTLDLSLSLSDPFKTSESSYQLLSRYLRQYTLVRASVLASFRYDFGSK